MATAKREKSSVGRGEGEGEKRNWHSMLGLSPAVAEVSPLREAYF